MATKTIYFSEDDLKIVDRAIELAGDGAKISPIIVEALKEFIEKRENPVIGMEEIQLEIRESNGKESTIRFIGHLLGEEYIEPVDRYYAVYKTAKGKFLVYRKFGAINLVNTKGIFHPAEYDIYDNIDDIQKQEYAGKQIPDRLLRTLYKQEHQVIFLDI